jgi:ankyrin repeat protein
MRDPAEAFRWLDADPGLASITNQDGQTPLMIATARNSTALIERLLQLGAPLDPLSALRLGRAEDFSRLLAARTNQPPPDEWLFEAVRCGQLGPLREMIAAGANPHAVDAEGHSLLFRAMAGQPEDMVEELNRQQCRTTLFDAAVKGDVARLDAAFDGQPEAVNTTNRNGLTLLYSAASASQLKSVELLLARGARADAVMPGGWTALHAAVVSDRADIALLLLNAGASPNVFGSGGMAPLHLAAASGATNSAELLLARGAAVNALPPEPDEYRGNAPLHWAAHLGKLDMFKLLLAHGADLSLLNGRKLTALQYAQLTTREHWGYQQPPGTRYQHDDTMFRSESRDVMLKQLAEAADSHRQ